MKASPKTPLTQCEGRPLRWLQNAILCVVLGLLVLRATIIEVPHVDQPQTRLFLSSEIVSLLISSILLSCVGLWILVSFVRSSFRWRKTGFGVAVGVFIFAGILSACFASNKRASITDIVTLATPMLVGLLLVQLLTSAVKIRLALLLILAVGAAATVQCYDQHKDSNQTLIDDYEADPMAHLEKVGIEPDGMEHWMYEHRLYSKDIRGFMMTSNSAASFFLLAAFTGLGLCLQAVSRKMSQEQIAALVCYGLVFGVVLFGLILTQSKGGIGAFFLGAVLLILLLTFGRTVWKRRLTFGILVLLMIIIAAGVTIHYGIQQGRLPGGNSMLVRWQYWASAVEMIRDHTLTGTGGGNFSEFYTHYKTPAASETVQNPHNWILSLLSQYGLLGLGAFLAAVLLPFYKVYGCLYMDTQLPAGDTKSNKNTLWIGLLAVSAVILLFVRPALVDAEFLYQRVDVRSAAYLVLYLFPAGVFMLAFVLLRVASLGDMPVSRRNNRLILALLCGLIAVLIHNLIDFAIFDPGNWSIFWLFVAILVAQVNNQTDASGNMIILDKPKRFGAVTGLVFSSLLYLIIVLLPPIRAEWYFKWAMTDDLRRVDLIETAMAADKLSSKTAYKSGLMFKQAYQRQRLNNGKRFLEKALEFAHIAASRNPADFKPWRLLAQINVLLAEQAEGEQKQQYLQSALDGYQQAVHRYPGSGRLHYGLANVAEQLGKNELALCHFKNAVEIEDAYRAQFRIMYPERKTVISRLGNAAYTEARARVNELQKNE